MKKKRIKSLLPSLKERIRYLAFEIISESKINNFKEIAKEISYNISKFMGDYGMAYASIHILADKFKNNKGIIKVNYLYLDHLRASLALIRELSQKKVIIRSLKASGTLKKASKFIG